MYTGQLPEGVKAAAEQLLLVSHLSFVGVPAWQTCARQQTLAIAGDAGDAPLTCRLMTGRAAHTVASATEHCVSFGDALSKHFD